MIGGALEIYGDIVHVPLIPEWSGDEGIAGNSLTNKIHVAARSVSGRVNCQRQLRCRFMSFKCFRSSTPSRPINGVRPLRPGFPAYTPQASNDS